MNNGPPAPSLPGDQLRALIATAQKMASEGAKEETNPDFAKLMKLIRHCHYVNQQRSQNAQQNGQTGFSQEHVDNVKRQVLAFQRLAQNQPIPEHIQQAIADPKAQEKMAAALSSTTPATVVQQRIVEAAIQEQQKIPSPVAPVKQEITGDPFSLIPKTISSSHHSLRHQRLLVPAAAPAAVDPYSMIHNREKYINTRIAYRIKELEMQSANLANEGPTPETADYNLKLKAAIELKALKLLDRQKQLREKILFGFSKATTLATAVDRTAYRRVKKQSLREARQTEKLERSQRFERERKEKQNHLDYLNSIQNHGRELINFHRQNQGKFSRLGQSMQKFHSNAEKEEQKRLQRISQERLRALKADDEEAYLKLLDQAKDSRIHHILSQTNSYLDNLTNAVLSQKKSIAGNQQVATEEEEEETVNKDYYNTAHKISEVVTEQPSILVGGKLKDYQIKGLQWMVSLYNNRLNGILADEMGLGKTIQTISLITYLIEKKKQNGPFLIIVPLSTITNWSLEFEKWAPAVAKVVFKGSPNERRAAAAHIRQGNFNVLLTTYEYIIKERPLLAKIKWIHMIIDEGHRMKNSQSKLSTTLMQYYSSRYRIILTGTPLQNNLPELWALLNFVLPKIFNSVKSFDEWFNSPFATAGVGQDKVELNEEESLLIIRRLHKVLRPFLLRRLKKDVESELPDKVETIIKCKMSCLQSRLYEQVRARRSVITDDGRNKGIKTLNNMVMQLRKICNHPFVFDEVENAINPMSITDDNIWRTAGKFELLDNILPKLKASGHRVLMFFQMTQIMDIMEDYLRYKEIQFLRLDGSTKADDRSELLKLYNAPDSPYFIFLLSTRAGGLGLNLQTADTVIIFDSDWNPHQDLQAQDRAHRIGQTKEVRILRLITSKSIEEVILARAQYKLDIDGKVIQAGKFDNKTSDAEREELLRTLFGSGDAEDDKDNDEEEGELDDEELNEVLSRNDEEMELFKRMDVESRERRLIQWKSAGNQGDLPPRLMQDSELPSIYLEDPHSTKHMEDLTFGRGARQRTDIVYDDGLNEEQWLDAIEDGDLSTAIQKKRDRSEKRKRTDDFAVSDNDMEDVEKSPKKKRGKKAFGIPDDLKESLPEATRQALTAGFNKCFEAVEQLVVGEGDYQRPRCVLFESLPNRQMYPDYYQIIKKPIAMDVIKARINSPYYLEPLDFQQDFMLMFSNAKTYNQEGSEVWVDADEMQKAFTSKFNELFPLPPTQPSQPVQQGLGIKLKLKTEP